MQIRSIRAALLAALAASCLTGAALAQTATPAQAPAKAALCMACHGPNGNATDPQYPVLAGQTMRYLYLQLRDFKEGRRKDAQMSPMAEPLSRAEMLELATWFSQQKPLSIKFKVDADKARLGKAKADEVLCTMCHLGGFAGQNEIPRVAGQHFQYVLKQLSDFKARRRTNDAGNMTAVAGTLSEADIENLAHYLANL